MFPFLQREYLAEPDLGFAFLERYQGRGFGTEASLAVMNAARRLGLPRLSAIVTPTNDRSLRLLAKLGFRFSHSKRLEGDSDEISILLVDL